MKRPRKSISILLSVVLLLNIFTSFKQGAEVKAVQLSNPTCVISLKEELEVGSKISGFKLETKKWIEDIQCTAMIFKHVKSGAKLIYLQNMDENKVFSISFRTPVHDNTGVNHIIEHSVLCGSKEYPVKDPFLIMTKQSLNTFINAFTGPDFTMYPVASKNEKDFNNLMSVYLDAVFYPNIFKDPRILKQEGWHYEINKKTGELSYNGIVYNEMKGSYSSPQGILSNTINKSLFKDNSYGFESGGNPENIPELTYEKFIETYKRYYVPSNSSIYLYGKLNIYSTLELINDNYLSKLPTGAVDSEIKLQKSYKKGVEKTDFYPIAKDSSTANMTYLSSNYVMDKVSGVEEILGFKTLEEILLNSESSPLRKTLLHNGIGVNLYARFNDSLQQPIFSIIAENTNEKEKYRFKSIIDDGLKQIVKNGFDSELIDSVLSTLEFNLHAQNSEANRGMNYMFAALSSWNYDLNPIEYLEVTPALNKIRTKIHSGYFEKLIKKYLLGNKHNSLVVLKPSSGLNEQKEELVKKKLEAYKTSLSEIQLAKITRDTQELKLWQETEDSKEDLSRIPTLSRKDLNLVAEEIPTIEKVEQEIKILKHPLFTDGIIYCNLYFDSSKVPQDKVLYLKLLASILGNVSTQRYNLMQLSNKAMSYTGGISFTSTAFRNNISETVDYSPKMTVSVNSLNTNLHKAFELIDETMNHSNFNDKKRIKELIKLLRANYESVFVNQGNNLAIERALSYMSGIGKYKDLDYIPYYNFICDLDDNFDVKFDEVKKELNNVSDIVFNKEGLVVSYTGDEKHYTDFQSAFNFLQEKIQNKRFQKQEYKFDFSKKNEAFVIPSQVQYVVKAGSFKRAGYNYSGKMKVAQNILNSDYLWRELRLKGGAYGGAMISTSEEILFYSYRDPNLIETIGTFDGVVKFLRSFKADEKEMTNYIIGTIGGMDSLTGPYYKGTIADNMYFSGATQEDNQKLRDEVLSTTAEDIRNLAQVFEAVIKQNIQCTVGGQNKINESKDLFDNIIFPIKNPK
ncbi:insulinase family protein [Clostridium sp. CS001]|uniref:insulinase family protein n=1 Tax=Clostridium sp. CS001 TaxID=2880648 RepID=UPI001CF4613A|nr:insulinase family protein [Clostridium sp. CS001]MCB2289288.1 insulinase family protein [Clostridium sp. CS001]